MTHSGIYCIVCSANRKKYIGSSNRIEKRLIQHFSMLRLGKHNNIHLQRAYDKYGKDSFLAKPLFYCDPSERLYFEEMIIKALSPEFNLSNIVDGTVYLSEETKIKIGNRLRGKANPLKGKPGHPCSEETKQKIRMALLGRKLPEEVKQKMSKSSKGKSKPFNSHPMSEMQKEKLREKLRGRPQSEEWRLKRLGHPVSQETREKIRNAQKGKPRPYAKKKQARW